MVEYTVVIATLYCYAGVDKSKEHDKIAMAGIHCNSIYLLPEEELGREEVTLFSD